LLSRADRHVILDPINDINAFLATLKESALPNQ
jgi:hypothetical protein